MFTKNGGKPSGGWWCGCPGGVKRTQSRTDDLDFEEDGQEQNKRRRMSTNRKPLSQRVSSTQRQVIMDDMGARQSQRDEKRDKTTAMTRGSQTSRERDTEDDTETMDNEQKSGMKQKQATLKNSGRVSSEWQHEKMYHSDSSETIDDEEHNGKKRKFGLQHSTPF